MVKNEEREQHAQALLNLGKRVTGLEKPRREVMLHETAVAWVRYKLARCVPARPWLETAEDYGARLKAVVADVNREHDLDSLCRDLPNRAQLVKDAEGGRIAK